MRDYQAQKNNPYYLERTLYRATLAVIRDYDRLRAEYDSILSASPAPPDGMPRSTKISDPTGRDAVRRAEMSRKLRAVEDALSCVPEEYRRGVWESAAYYKRYPDDADRTTYWRYKARFIYNVAQNLSWI